MRELTQGFGPRSSLLAIATAALALHALNSVAQVGGTGLEFAFGDLLFSALVLAGAAACLLHSAHLKGERPAWLALGVGLGCWALGDGFDGYADENGGVFPTLGDGLALLFYPAACAAMYFFAREWGSPVRASLLLDAGIVALASASVGAALRFGAGPIDSSGGLLASATSYAFVVGDLVVIAAVVGALAVAGWRPGRRWLLVGAGIVAGVLADLVHAHGAGTGFHPSGGVLASAWPAAALLICYAAFEPYEQSERLRTDYGRIMTVPIGFAFVAATMLVLNQVRPVGAVSFGFAVAALVATAVRPALVYRENVRVLTRSQREALTDALTGLGNRRRLMVDLREQIRSVEAKSPRVLILFDLDGFKQYNDTFGHPAGDALLGRLGANLQKAVGPYGGVYRMGGDEFCVLLKVGMASVRTLTSIAAAALSEHGEGFAIRSSYGAVMLPQEARDPALALKIADQRMYAQKEKRRPSTSRQTRDILLQVLRERDPELSDHMSAVGELSRRVGQHLKLLPEELDETVRAAELHDIGKMAIPDAILQKPGPLEEEEWQFVHKHTIIGERILGAAPALIPVAKVVRSSHERWDGQGYPDGISGEAIPIGARIVAACDAFHAMTTARPYGTTMTAEEAISEMRKAAGTEFDPRVVVALCEVVSERYTLSPTSEPAS
jgi:two-component system cell cycle response regulator